MPTLYDNIAANRRKTFVLVLLFPLLLTLLMYATVLAFAHFTRDPQSPYTALESANSLALTIFPFIIGGSFLWLLISYYTGGNMMLSAAGASEILRSDNPEIYSLVENVAITAGMPTPKVYIIGDSSLNAFAAGRDPQHSSLALTKGLIQKLDRSELEAVVAHEMAHIANRDVRLMTLVITGIGILTLLGEIIFRAGMRGRGKKSQGLLIVLLGLVIMLYGFALAPLIMYAISRRQEYQADATAALTTRNPLALAGALKKISADSGLEALDAMPLIGAACIADAKARGGKSFLEGLSGLYATHPPIEARIAALKQIAG
ncbi:MAG: M48 family metallopeptidase [Elusimicrobiota bacterium]|jgi:heat shock protein HtpX|nr:M48 family metallopeptidase [Elusimicrobiota bacterium]